MHGVIPAIASDLVAIARLRFDAGNARRHGVENVDAIEASLRAHGQHRHVVVQSPGMVVRAGEGTVKAAARLGWTHVAALLVDEDDAAATARAIADNATAELSTWDPGALRAAVDEAGRAGLPPAAFALTAAEASAALEYIPPLPAPDPSARSSTSASVVSRVRVEVPQSMLAKAIASAKRVAEEMPELGLRVIQ